MINLLFPCQVFVNVINPNLSMSSFGQCFSELIEYNRKNIFLKNHVQNVVDKLVPDPFVKSRNKF